jgi:hypothetical protein
MIQGDDKPTTMKSPNHYYPRRRFVVRHLLRPIPALYLPKIRSVSSSLQIGPVVCFSLPVLVDSLSLPLRQDFQNGQRCGTH